MCSSQPGLAVVVGVDNSAAARRAAVWAVDEAVSRDIPLKLVHILEPESSDLAGLVAKRSRGEIAIRQAVSAIETTGKPVKLESEILSGGTAGMLIRLSRRAVMLCVGAVGSDPDHHGLIGSTAVAIAGSAHCPLAVVHGAAPLASAAANLIMVATDDSPDDGVLLHTAVREAALRAGPLRVITCWRPPHSDVETTKEGDRQIRAQLERRLARWRHAHSGISVETVPVHGDLADYVRTHAAELQMLIVSARGPGHVRDVVGPVCNAALARAACTVLIVDRLHL
ncbi:universal stress protein [Mycobacterium sp.]|uniref:universal stress protein n=1 Tax=Mycobacterium sp. TaxID=1785 RepID=UPI0025CBEA5F|nr:universal stress protein [Mycobacterium sp.]